MFVFPGPAEILVLHAFLMRTRKSPLSETVLIVNEGNKHRQTEGRTHTTTLQYGPRLQLCALAFFPTTTQRSAALIPDAHMNELIDLGPLCSTGSGVLPLLDGMLVSGTAGGMPGSMPK